MDNIANAYIDEAKSLINSKSYLEYFSYFKNVKLKHIARLYEKAAYIYELIELFSDAADCYVSSATYYIEYGIYIISALNHCKAGECYQKSKNYQKSTVSYLMAIEQQTEHDFIIKCSANIAENYFALGNYSECIKWFESCIIANCKIGRDDMNFNYYDKLGIIYCTCLKKYAISITIYDKLVELLINKKDTESLNIYLFISVLLRILANDDDMEFAKTYFAAKDKIFFESEYGNFIRNIFFFANADSLMLKKIHLYYNERLAGLDNINVKTLIYTLINKYI